MTTQFQDIFTVLDKYGCFIEPVPKHPIKDYHGKFFYYYKSECLVGFKELDVP